MFDSLSLFVPHRVRTTLDCLGFKYYVRKALAVLTAVAGGRLQDCFLHIRVLHLQVRYVYYFAVFVVSTGSVIERYAVLNS